MVVIDRSGSMGGAGGNGQTKLKEAQDAASLFVQLIRSGAGDTIGMDSSSTSAMIPPGGSPVVVTPASKQNLVGNAPYTGGAVGAVVVGGNTSIGDGLRVAKNAFPAPHGGSKRAILLLTDGLQNTTPMIADVEGQLGGIKLFIVGYGDDAHLDGPLLTSSPVITTDGTSALTTVSPFGSSLGSLLATSSNLVPSSTPNTTSPPATARASLSIARFAMKPSSQGLWVGTSPRARLVSGSKHLTARASMALLQEL